MRSVISVMLSVVLWAGLGAPPAFAQSGASPGEEDLEKASRLYQEAEAHYNLREYEEALALFRESYLLSKEPALLLNMGQCYRFLERYDDALLTYEVYLREDPDSPYRGDVESLIVEMKKLIEQKKSGEETTSPDTPPETPSVSGRTPEALQPMPEGPSDVRPRGASPVIFYGIAGGSGLLGVIFGSAALASLAESRQVFNGDRPESERLFQRARTLGVVCDVFLVSSLVSGGLGYLKARQKKASAKGAALAGGR